MISCLPSILATLLGRPLTAHFGSRPTARGSPGTQGVVKRWSFLGFGQTHGTHEYRRHPGAIGQRKTPGRVYPNKKLPGHYGVENNTTQNLQVIEVIADKGLLLVKGGVAGHNNGLLIVKPSVKVATRAAHKLGKK